MIYGREYLTEAGIEVSHIYLIAFIDALWLAK